jgi:hypothetical protein
LSCSSWSADRYAILYREKAAANFQRLGCANDPLLLVIATAGERRAAVANIR